MFVRTVYAVGDPQKLDAAIEALRSEGRAMLSEQPGYRGMGLFADREQGKLSIGTWWESEKARQDSDEALRTRRAQLLRPFATTMTIDDWEVIAAQRPGRLSAGACMRLTRLEFDPMDADLGAETMRGLVMERLKAMPGVVGIAMFMNRAKGRSTVAVLYQDREALGRSRGSAALLRDDAVGKAHSTVRSVEEFEVVMTESVGEG
ncbi:hypothetical protein KGA66_10710 [Actinocrinis puniceicyclus]|uniref:ABM domain-containing protein n=1 Tax=Actinocrinis puniceicyclus TaxID=977794 RepID=A0A8J8BE83_9ACTN|nr:antibiotic biosynthesis monooxygenase [Actinocrinis puniceicyclus]MBS2963519.1 hypothetical protein [Actinocrinis puniceicyclus]